jgi:2,5-diketo-D-gluconate reductase B
MIGRKYGKSSAQIALRWLIEQDNVIAIPRSSKREHIESNFDIFDFELDDEDRRLISALPKNERIINPDFAPEWENINSRSSK